MFDMVVKVLDVIHPGWRDYLIGVATDGARNMTGRHVVLLTFLDDATGPNFIRVAITCWLFMIKVMSWFKKHRIALLAYLDEKLPPCRPSAAWEFAAPLSSVEQFVRGLGTFVSLKLDEITSKNGARHHVLGLVGSALLSAALQLTSITAEQNCVKEQAVANDQLPPVMPHELVKYGQSQFCVTVRKHVLQLHATKFKPQQIETIEEH
ncbi:hypothetical protein AXG93_684s1320 [Marchantia polymorpha subsp. ruderalis]|uniref:Uncharacterized protein n=1 Tax=Marchantia polymorpha subsp. ruderalis TaxID=1480154 RepID=A0A176W877_MARPO|nr:hypothetical protein AXG93_684s1320 [Marchantia polymorpha subsp. ruderalis]